MSLGKVDLLGLNAFGKNAGMNALYGTLIGGGVSGTTAILLKRRGASNADMKGFLAGVAVSAVLYFMKKTRHAAFGSLAGAFFAAGLSWVAGRLLGTGTAVTPTAGIGLPQLQALNGLGVPQINYLNGRGLGIPGIAPVPPTYGAIATTGVSGFAGPTLSQSPPVDLLGQMTSAAHGANLLGAPALSGLSAAYGATLLGGGRN